MNPTRFLAAVSAIFLVGCAGFTNSLDKVSGASSMSSDVLRQQIYLDSKNFGPGVIDGRLGEFTRKALVNYRQSKSLPQEWMPDVSGISGYTTYKITARDLAQLGSNASEPEDQAKQRIMGYTTLIELISERFHTTQKYLRNLNPQIDINSSAAGTTVTVPNVARPYRYESYPSSYSAPSFAVARSRHITVDLGEKILSIHEKGKLIAAFPITPGSAEHPAPVGEWRIVGSVPFPWYRYDLGVLKRGERTDNYYNLPPGPNNPVGILWAGLNRPGIGIHGTPAPDTIGRAGSHGCIRLSNWDAATFYTLVGKGTKVSIQ